VDELLAQGRDPSTIRNAIKPLAVIFRRAVEDGDLAVNPTERLRLPIARGRRERIAAPEEAVRLISALPASERALWAIAFYGGLRLGELRALEWKNVRLDLGEIRVEHNMDGTGVIIPPKSRAGRRVVPIIRRLRDELVLHQLATRSATGLVFGSTPTTPFVPNTAYRRASRAWAAASLDPIGLHEARHTFASYMIAAGTNIKSITEIMGHASVIVSIDRYGHMMPGGRDEVVEPSTRTSGVPSGTELPAWRLWSDHGAFATTIAGALRCRRETACSVSPTTNVHRTVDAFDRWVQVDLSETRSVW
jgi:integrase